MGYVVDAVCGELSTILLQRYLCLTCEISSPLSCGRFYRKLSGTLSDSTLTYRLTLADNERDPQGWIGLPNLWTTRNRSCFVRAE